MSKREGQDPEGQLQALRSYATHSGWAIVSEFVDQQSGATVDRPELARMLAAADRREFDMLLFFRFDRLTRSGIVDTLQILKELRNNGIEFHSLQEPHIRSAGPMGELLISIMATFAAIEREANIQRTIAGLDKARKQGKTLGRPRRIADLNRLQEMKAAGSTYAEIAEAAQISRATVFRMLKKRAERV